MATGDLLNGKIALITGGSRGLGRAILEAFAAAGAEGIAFDLTPPAEDLPPGWAFEPGDVTLERDIMRVCEQVGENFGRLDCLVANAGIVPPWRNCEAIEMAEWDRVFAVNVRGVMASIKHAVPLMKEAGGSIIAMASINAIVSHPKQMAYTASKLRCWASSALPPAISGAMASG